MIFFKSRHPEYSFDDIRSFTDEEVVAAAKEWASDKFFLETVAAYFSAGKPSFLQPFLKKKVVKYLITLLKSVDSVASFQKNIISDLVIAEIKKRTVKSIHYSGFENLNPNDRYIFLSNHRDIVCDAAFFEDGMLKHGLKTTEIAFGSNLLVNKSVEKLIRSNKGCIFYRGLDLRKQYEEYSRFSAYIGKLMNDNQSLWLAHRPGRSKDASHETNPTVLKMIYLAGRSRGVSFPEYMNFCQIVPVAVSYERDPAVPLMAKALVFEERDGKYEKSRDEDLQHIISGVTGYKGEIHIAVGTPIDFTPFGKNAEAAALEIDRFIHTQFVPGAFHYIAYDRMFHTDRFSCMYTDDDETEFDSLYSRYEPMIYKKILLQYANPVVSKIKIEEMRK